VVQLPVNLNQPTLAANFSERELSVNPDWHHDLLVVICVSLMTVFLRETGVAYPWTRIVRQGGIGFVLPVSASSQETNEAIVRLFRADRAREYDEFAERCTAFLNEINRESNAGKYTFAEMEESEQDLEKLARWLAKIQARDFFPDGRRQQSAALLARCQNTLEGFSQAVYTAEGVQDPEEDVAPGIAETATERTAAPEPADPDGDAMITP